MIIANLVPKAYQKVDHARHACTDEDVSMRNVRTSANLISASFSSASGAIGHLGYSIYDLLTLHFTDSYRDLKTSVKSTYNCAVLALTGAVALVVPSVVNLVHYDERVEMGKEFVKRYNTLIGVIGRDLPRNSISYETIDGDGNIQTIVAPRREVQEDREGAEILGQAIMENLAHLNPEQDGVDRLVQAVAILDQMHQGTTDQAAMAIMQQVDTTQVVPTQGLQTFSWSLHIEEGQMVVKGFYQQPFGDINDDGKTVLETYRADFVWKDIGTQREKCTVNCRKVEQTTYEWLMSFLPGGFHPASA